VETHPDWYTARRVAEFKGKDHDFHFALEALKVAQQSKVFSDQNIQEMAAGLDDPELQSKIKKYPFDEHGLLTFRYVLTAIENQRKALPNKDS